MTVQEYRLDWYKQGFVIQEGILGDSPIVNVLVVRIDTDGLRLEHRFAFKYEIYERGSVNVYIDAMKESINLINGMINKRHAQNINSCSHDMILVNDKKSCSKCMGKFGEKMSIDLNLN